MAVKRVCDCCGKEITKDVFMTLGLLPFRALRGVTFKDAPCFTIYNQELCDSCAEEVYKNYRLMKANKKGKTLKRVCINCGNEDNNNPICPVCKSQNWEIEEE